MNIRRDDNGDNPESSALEKIEHCIGKLQSAENFEKGLKMESPLVKGLSIEKVIQALLQAHFDLKEQERIIEGLQKEIENLKGEQE